MTTKRTNSISRQLHYKRLLQSLGAYTNYVFGKRFALRTVREKASILLNYNLVVPPSVTPPKRCTVEFQLLFFSHHNRHEYQNGFPGRSHCSRQ